MYIFTVFRYYLPFDENVAHRNKLKSPSLKNSLCLFLSNDEEFLKKSCTFTIWSMRPHPSIQEPLPQESLILVVLSFLIITINAVCQYLGQKKIFFQKMKQITLYY